VWNGILEHRERIDSAMWVFLWCLDAITQEKEGVGLVHGGAPVKVATIAVALQFDECTVRQHLKHLERTGYIRRRRTPYGYVVEVCNSRKFGVWRWHKRSGENPRSEAERSGVSQQEIGGNPPERSGEIPRNKEDAARNAAKRQQQPAAALASNPETSVWSFLGTKPCGPISFRTLLESRWVSRNGNRPSVLIGETVDAWEAADGGKLRRAPQLFRALSELRRKEKQDATRPKEVSEPIHVLAPEEIPA